MERSPISKRIVRARFYSNFIKLTIIHVYALTNDAEEEKKYWYYDQQGEVIVQVKQNDMMVITEDMNA